MYYEEHLKLSSVGGSAAPGAVVWASGGAFSGGPPVQAAVTGPLTGGPFKKKK